MKYEECRGCREQVEFGTLSEDGLCVHCDAIEECDREEEERVD